MTDGYFEHINKAEPYKPYISLDNENFSFLAHYHEETEVLHMCRGQMTVNVNNTSVTLNEGDIFIISPGDIHSMNALPGSATTVFKFYTPEIIYSYDITTKISTSDDCYGFFKDIIFHLSDEYVRKNPGFEIAICTLADTILLSSIRMLMCPKLDSAEKAAKRKHILLLKKINDYCQNHYTEQISLDDISSACNYSKYYFSHIFSAVTSMSFSDFLSAFRVEKAKEMFRYDTTVSKVAYECGFNNLRSFNRAFKKHTNTTPSEYISTHQTTSEPC